MSTHSSFLQLIERDALHGLPSARRAALHDHLRACGACRAHHDRLHDAFRVLEGDPPVGAFELAQVERWVAQDLAPRRWSWSRLGLWLAPALVAALAALFVFRPAPPVSNRMTLTAKGAGEPPALSVEVLCGDRPSALHAAAPAGCSLDDTLAFAWRPGSASAGQLTLFGVDASGRARYYAPTPVEPAGVAVGEAAWQAAPLSVRLRVNHTPGGLRLFALLAPTAPSVEQIDAWAAALAGAPLEDPHTPWHRALGPEHMRALCGPDGGACHSARLELTLHEDDR